MEAEQLSLFSPVGRQPRRQAHQCLGGKLRRFSAIDNGRGDAGRQLVIADDTEAIPVLWTELDLSSLKKARYALAEREGISSTYVDRSVGVWSPSVSSERRETATIDEWAASRGVSCVVWTALRPNSMGGPGRPSCDQVVRYLAGLEGESSRLAEEYIRRAPRQIRTPYRPIIERDLGWTPAIST